jgi:predicted transcriptional regulator
MINNKLKFSTRSQIAEKMGVAPKTVKRYIDNYKDEILKLDPLFKDRVLISPKIIRFLYEKFWGSDQIDNE